MGNTKSIIIGVIVCFSFLWGYNQQSITTWYSKGKDNFTTDNTPSSDGAPDVDSNLSAAVPSSPDAALSPSPSAFPAPSATPGVFPSPHQIFNLPSSTASPIPSPNFPPPPEDGYQNPYERFLRDGAAPGGPTETMSDVMDSIRPGEIAEDQRKVRNAYFDKLSEQLQELRGETPPEQGGEKAPSQATVAPDLNQPTSEITEPEESLTDSLRQPMLTYDPMLTDDNDQAVWQAAPVDPDSPATTDFEQYRQAMDPEGSTGPDFLPPPFEPEVISPPMDEPEMFDPPMFDDDQDHYDQDLFNY